MVDAGEVTAGAAIAPTREPRASFWTAQLVGWGLFAVVDLVNRQLLYGALPEAVVLTLIAYAAWVLLSAGLRWLYGRLCAEGQLNLRTVGLVALFSPLAAGLGLAGIGVVRSILGWRVPDWDPLEQVILPLAHYSLAFLAWSICYLWVRAEQARQRARERAVAARMDALKAEIRSLQLQLDPHFLFNALNGLAEEVPEHPDAALAMIRDLTQYLRHLLAGIRHPVVSVAAEVEGLSAYLRIQKARFGERVQAVVETDPAVASWPIANLLLQPLVENAFEHGDRARRLDVRVAVAAEGQALRVEVSNTGRLAAAGGAARHHGIGLANVRRRLDVHYPGRHTFALQQAPGDDGAPGGGRVVAVLRLEGEPCSAF